MKNIEIKTTHNVTLEYELADLRDRILAFLLDFVCMLIVIGILSSVGAALFGGSEVGGTILGALVFSVFAFYSLAFETLNNGQSIGKMALRIRVIKTASGKAVFSDYAARWIFRMIDIYFSLGGIASILIVSSSKAQRIGDIVAHTAVVKTVPKMDLRLRDLMDIHAKDYKLQYPQAKQLHEEDALVIKRTLDRSRQFDNDAHQEAMELLAQRVRTLLAIEGTPGNDRIFLQTILKDYVVLTR